jgi:hypothetical protein
VRIDVISASAADYDELVRLQRQAFADVPGAAQRADLQTSAYYRWKYAPPAGEAKVAQIREEGELIAMNAMFPMDLTRMGASLRGWQSCDTATSPVARGKGCFTKCLAALHEVVGPSETFFGFPNPNSSAGFRKAGWREIDRLQLFAGLAFGGRQQPDIVQISSFDAASAAIASPASPSIRVSRTKAYLDHRYLSPARPMYDCFASSQGYAVLGVTTMNSARIGLIMDVQAKSRKAKGRLVSHLCASAREKGCVGMVAINNTEGSFDLARHGLLRIPERFSPRRLILMAQPGRPASEGPWSCQLGDWDGF